MRNLLAALAVLTFSVGAVAGVLDGGDAPAGVRGDAKVSGPVYFTHDINTLCGKAPEGYVKVACTNIDTQRMVLPNPCDPKYAGESFAQTACHELGHINGWPADHPRPWPPE